MNNQTPLNEILLNKKDLRLLKSFSDGVPRDCGNNIEEYKTLLAYDLLTNIHKIKYGLSVPTNTLKINNRGIKYLRDHRDKRIHFVLSVIAAAAAVFGVICQKMK